MGWPAAFLGVAIVFAAAVVITSIAWECEEGNRQKC